MRIPSQIRTSGFLILLAATALGAEPAVQSNVVYGMCSGAALLLDVHRPANLNGYGVILISGSAWSAPVAYSAPQLKSITPSIEWAKPLVAAGYTVFTVNHRVLPRFPYPAAVEDVQRAVRFIRHNAASFGIRLDRIGAAGGSSGGHLVAMLGTLDGKGKPDDPDPVERESARVQCVVARAAPVNFFKMRAPAGTLFLGMSAPTGTSPAVKKSLEYQTYYAASPVFHVSPGDPPFLLMHGEKDDVVPFAQSEEMEQALKTANVPVKLLRIEGGVHGPTFAGARNPADFLRNPPDYLSEMVAWFNRYLLVK